MDTIPFDIHTAIPLIEKAVEPYPKAALFELAQQGYSSPFEILVACILSIRTLDEVSLPMAKRLFARARTPRELADLTPAKITPLIRSCTFPEQKAQTIHALAARVETEFGGELPCDQEVILSFSGVGPKCANLTLGIACGQPFISVDIHVHRITNRWGYVQATTPEKTMVALEKVLPKEYWVDINRLLVPFGKHICTGSRPKCSTCPVRGMCPRVGVEESR
jgi:endonuclease III